MSFTNLFDKVETAYYNLTYGVANLIRWFPPIWRDRDWDYCYMGNIMHQKLLWMAHHHQHYGNHVGNERQAKRMRVTAELLRRVMENEYLDRAMKAEGISYPARLDEPTGNGPHELRWGPDPDRQRRAYLSERANVQLHAELELVGKLLSKYFLHWWD